MRFARESLVSGPKAMKMQKMQMTEDFSLRGNVCLTKILAVEVQDQQQEKGEMQLRHKNRSNSNGFCLEEEMHKHDQLRVQCQI